MNQHVSFTEAISQSGFETIDFIIVIAYIILLVSIGVFISREREGKATGVKDYFLAGNTLTWWAVGASLIAANVSTEQFIGQCGTGYADGIAIAAYEIMAAIVLVFIGKFMLPIMMERKLFTVPQFLYERYNSGVGLTFSFFWLFLFIFVNLTSVTWLGALAVEQILGLQQMVVSVMGIEMSARMVIAITFLIIAGIYTVHGGFTSVAWTDVMQVTFIIGGGLVTTYFILRSVAGNEGTITEAMRKIYAFATTGDHATDSHFHLIVQESRDPNSFTNVPGLAAIVGGIWLSNIGYWGLNQYLIQKGLAARDVHEAQKGLMFAAFLKILVPLIVIAPGLCAFYLMNNQEQYHQFQGVITSSDDAYPWLIRNFTPTGIKGLAFVAIIASVISSLASMLNSTSALFTMDIYKKYINKDASEQRLVNVGRISASLALMIAAIAIKPMVGGQDQAYQYIQEYSGFIYPGIIIVFIFGLFWKRASNTAAVWTSIVTIPLGVVIKMLFPDVAFHFRAGYVFITVFFLFVFLSYQNRKTLNCTRPEETDRKTMRKWGYILGSIGLVLILAASIVTLSQYILPDNVSPEDNIIAYLNDIGFQTFFFFGILVGGCAVFLLSNAHDTKRDKKALPVDLSLFQTTRGYTYGSIAISVITLLLYILFW